MSPSFKNIGLDNWDHFNASDGLYFVTICTKNKKHYFGKVVDETMRLNTLGKIAYQCWEDIPKHFPHVKLDEFIIMPNHVHGIITIKNKPCVRTQNCPVGTQNFVSLQKMHSNDFGPQSKNLASIIRGFKIGVKKYSTVNGIPFSWQPRFYDRIIRDDKSWYFMQEYIIDNPKNWHADKYFQ